ncbi:MAG: bifunctional metallophosphatase/5'-nucleotidase [Anaerolineae bacterium]
MNRQRTARRYRLILIALVLTALLSGCTQLVGHSGETTTLTILYTNDEHGWMAPTEDTGGAAGMLRRWREEEGYTPNGPFLVLGGGDIWTGPALSTWFDGEPMVEVLNVMGYHAVAVGNHEFDYGLEGLRERAAEAEFAFLGANVTAEGAPVNPILPYVIETVAGPDGEPGLQVGIIGLASQRTPRTTMPTHVAGIDFEDYAATLARTAPEVREAGADVLVVVSHLCGPELQALVPVAADLDIAMMGGGHCHRRVERIEEGVALVEANWRMEAYARVDLTVDSDTGEVRDVAVAVKPNPPGPGDAEVEAVVARWEGELSEVLFIPIGYTENGVRRGSNAMMNMVTDAWLAGYPADIAMSNPGGFRQDIDAGEITLADVVGVLPFDNTLVDVALTGEQVILSYQHGQRRPAVGGMVREGTRYLIDGEPIDPDAVYHVLVNDFMYAGGDGYAFAEYDPDAYMTGIDWRQPVIEWISGLNTTPENPLELYLDDTSR